MIEGLLMNTEEINQLWAEVCSRVKSYEGIIGPQVDALFSQLFPQAASDSANHRYGSSRSRRRTANSPRSSGDAGNRSANRGAGPNN